MKDKKEASQNPITKITVDKAVEALSNAVDANVSSNEAIENLRVKYNLSDDAIQLITEKYEELG